MQGFPKGVLTDVKRYLEDERDRIAKRIDELSKQDPFSDPERASDNAASDHEAQEESSHDRFAALVDELKGKLAAVNAALARISHDSYGYCTNCGDMIDTDRLAVIPTATLCLNCEKNKK